MFSGQGIQYLGASGNQSAGTLIIGRILMSVGGGTLFITTQVAAQASVGHADMAMAIAIIGLWTQLGGGVGAAISGAVWNENVPKNLEKYVGDTYNATQRAEIFGTLLKARKAEPHDLINQAYTDGIRPLYLAALIISLLAFIPALLTREIYLGKSHNVVDERDMKDMQVEALPEPRREEKA
jgi:MFS family permease